MGVLIFLIILDIVVMGAVLFYVIREPGHRQPAQHPYLNEPAASGDSGEPAQPPQTDAD